MKTLRQSLVLLVLFGIIGFAVSSRAADVPETDTTQAAPEKSDAEEGQEPEQVVNKDLVLKGDTVCTACHDEADSPELLYIGRTRHGTAADSRTPTCTRCHGESKQHILNPGRTRLRPKPDHVYSGQISPGNDPANNRRDRYFGLQGNIASTSVDERNAACLECHSKDSKRSHWEGSAHQAHDVACTSCHRIHAAKDPVVEKRTQADICYVCHKEQRAQNNKPSHHPVPEGKMACSDCHNAHGSVGPKLMKRDSVNETCYTCHMEKRGPFVHNHEPVDDDCTNCHNPHGTTAESMLKMRPPALCNSCHSPHGAVQPSLDGQTPAAPRVTFSGPAITQGGACMNCHTEVHGSNNPGTAPANAQFLFR
jgi:DmsE family decaheme c-type cytochrome